MSRIANGFLVMVLMITFLSATTLTPCAKAAVIDTSSYIQKSGKMGRDELISMVGREDVQEHLVSLGVNPEYACKRIAAMNESELRAVQQKIDEMPAGGDILVVLGIVLVVLIVLEILGVTNVFTKL